MNFQLYNIYIIFQSYTFQIFLILLIIFLVLLIVLLINKYNKQQSELLKLNSDFKEERLISQFKEQELKTITSLIESQEQERLKVVNDLHDDLGSIMGALKMYFSKINENESKNLLQKTNSILDEAYQKIRNIAQAKQTGLVAKEGLLNAVTQLADDISNTQNLKVNVLENGLNRRIENTLELNVFRTIQELVVNIVKHADASGVDIHLNMDEHLLNIMIEDNGKGFSIEDLTKENSGLGLKAIERRINNLDGNMILESKPKSGTSVIIDIPL